MQLLHSTFVFSAWRKPFQDTSVLSGCPPLRTGKGLVAARAYKNIVFDIGGVLLTWSTTADVSPLDPGTFWRIIRSDVCHAYEMGQISKDEFCYRLADRSGLPLADIKLAIERTGETVRPITEMVGFVQELKRRNQDVHLFCMSNMGREDWQYVLQKYPDCWASFEQTFPPWAAGMRKPQLTFFKHVIEEAKIEPEDTIYIDDTAENLLVAQELGFECVLHRNVSDTLQQVAALLPNMLVK